MLQVNSGRRICRNFPPKLRGTVLEELNIDGQQNWEEFCDAYNAIVVGKYGFVRFISPAIIIAPILGFLMIFFSNDISFGQTLPFYIVGGLLFMPAPLFINWLVSHLYAKCISDLEHMCGIFSDKHSSLSFMVERGYENENSEVQSYRDFICIDRPSPRHCRSNLAHFSLLGTSLVHHYYAYDYPLQRHGQMSNALKLYARKHRQRMVQNLA